MGAGSTLDAGKVLYYTCYAMRILFLADGRSPIALNWIAYFLETGDEVHLVSLYPCPTDPRFASVHWLRIPFLGSELAAQTARGLFARRLLPARWRTTLRQHLVPLGLGRAARELHRWLERVQPDLIHAMRIPYEGMVAALVQPACPLLISVWGNDLTLHATANPLLRQLTRQTLARASALHSDCHRDQRLAVHWGFDPRKPAIVLPGAGGVQRQLFRPQAGVDRQPIVVNPRGLRAYVRNDTFFGTIPLVRRAMPEVRFLCPAMQGEAEAERWVQREGVEDVVKLLPRLSRAEMALLFQQAAVTVSITEHDGTPNTLLEAMACGSFPIAGDLEPLREWITPGVNGALVSPADRQGLAETILWALSDEQLRQRACEINQELIDQRADYAKVMPQAQAFYRALVSSSPRLRGRDGQPAGGRAGGGRPAA
ncbi:MAG: glycosyltransferase family 4 protein [Anaerolineales bacterium]|nr:glycosyltransferase family 4 protein [Anaerolineales bacterium]MDW8446638.1 glycosyltransferase family 4 protein [Anaerolineales bacterium]